MRFSFVPAVLTALFVASCQSPQTPLDEPDVGSDPFSIVLSQFSAEPDLPPLLDGDTLLVRVRYEGDCTDHAFKLEQAFRSDTLVLSLRHDANGDTCEGVVYDEMQLGLPEPLPLKGPVILRNPRGGAPFVLRK